MSSCNNNRIPRDSVSLSNNVFVFEAPDIRSEEERRVETEKEKNLREREGLVEQRAIELTKRENENSQLKLTLEKRLEDIEIEKMEFMNNFKTDKEEFEKKKRRDYYDMRLFMWNTAIDLAESMIYQEIDKNQVSFAKSLHGMLSKLPVAFDELTISVNPETVTKMKEESGQVSWVLQDVKWKYDFSLAVGEFIIEEESEFYEHRFSAMFEEVRKRMKNKVEVERPYD